MIIFSRNITCTVPVVLLPSGICTGNILMRKKIYSDGKRLLPPSYWPSGKCGHRQNIADDFMYGQQNITIEKNTATGENILGKKKPLGTCRTKILRRCGMLGGGIWGQKDPVESARQNCLKLNQQKSSRYFILSPIPPWTYTTMRQRIYICTSTIQYV